MEQKEQQDKFVEKLKQSLIDAGFDESKIVLSGFGSVAINGKGSDIDVLLYIPHDYLEKVREYFRENNYSADAAYAIYNDGWGSFKLDDYYNVICYHDERLFRLQEKAFNICVQLREVAEIDLPKGLRRAIHEFLRQEYVEFDNPSDKMKELLQ